MATGLSGAASLLVPSTVIVGFIPVQQLILSYSNQTVIDGPTCSTTTQWVMIGALTIFSLSCFWVSLKNDSALTPRYESQCLNSKYTWASMSFVTFVAVTVFNAPTFYCITGKLQGSNEDIELVFRIGPLLISYGIGIIYAVVNRPLPSGMSPINDLEQNNDVESPQSPMPRETYEDIKAAILSLHGLFDQWQFDEEVNKKVWIALNRFNQLFTNSRNRTNRTLGGEVFDENPANKTKFNAYIANNGLYERQLIAEFLNACRTYFIRYPRQFRERSISSHLSGLAVDDPATPLSSRRQSSHPPTPLFPDTPAINS